jgi:hypothetical protein
MSARDSCHSGYMHRFDQVLEVVLMLKWELQGLDLDRGGSTTYPCHSSEEEVRRSVLVLQLYIRFIEGTAMS